MNAYQITNHIDSVIREYEARASHETNVTKLTDIYSTIAQFKVIRKFVNELEVDLAKAEYEAIKGRKVLSIDAESKAEALVAMDMIKNVLMNTQPQSYIHEAVYVTDEGSTYCG